MISRSTCVNKVCNICYHESPNYHCSQCSFVLCKTCKLAMEQLNLDTNCSQCRKGNPWMKSYDNISKINQPNNWNCNITINEENYKCINKYCVNFLSFLIFIGLSLFVGFIHSLILNNKAINNMRFPINIFYYLFSGIIIVLLFGLCMLFAGLCLLACTSQGTPRTLQVTIV